MQLRRLKTVGRPALGWSDPEVRSVLLLMSPRLLAYGINSVNTVVSTRFAASLGNSSVSHLYYANRLKELVLGGFAVSVATAILPTLSQQARAEDRGPFKDHLAFALRLIAFVTVPASVGLVALQVPIVRVLFQGGRFGAADTQATAGALAALALGLFFFAGIRVVVPAFYALKNTTLPVVAALADAAVFIGLCAWLTRPLGLPGIGLAASAAAALNVGILLVALRRREGRLRGRAIASSLWRIVAASAAMGILLWAAGRALPPEIYAGWKGAGILAAVIAAATACYWLAARWLGAPEPGELARLAALPSRVRPPALRREAVKGPPVACCTTFTTGFASPSLAISSWTSVACRSCETGALPER